MTDNTDALPPLPEPDGWAVGDCYYPNPRTKIAMGDIRFGTAARRYTEEQVSAALAQRQQVPEGWQLIVDAAIEALEWHASSCCEDSIPQATVDALDMLRRASVTAALAQCQQVPEFKGVPAWKIRERVATTGQTAAEALRDLCAEGRAALTAAPSAQAEPVAQEVGHLHSNGDFCQTRKVEYAVWPIPLYAAPPHRVGGTGK